ncbi:hypothetical protein ACFX14_037693 [Malus domestica]
MQVKDSSSFYSIQLDEDDIITNMFWADSRSISDYGLFGDVICFDTMYRTNEYGRPFAPILGVNHHKQTVVFGAALLYEESKDEEEWLYAWNDMIEKYDLKGNKWLKDLFAVKEKWALSYGRHFHCRHDEYPTQ